jgi:hypothetical protein
MTPDGPTYADVRKILRLSEKAAEARARVVAAWRAQHPEATCSDAVARCLAEMDAYRPRRSA